MERKRAPGGGRKPKGNFAGKSAAFTTRITPELRALLDEEAEREGMSVSQIVEQRLRSSYDQPKNMEKALGKKHVRALAYLVARLVKAIEASTGRDWREDQFTSIAVKESIVTALNMFRAKGAMIDPDVSTIEIPESVKKQIEAYKNAQSSYLPDDMDDSNRLRDPFRFGILHLSAILNLFGGMTHHKPTAALIDAIDDSEFRYDENALANFMSKHLRIGGLE